MAIDRHKLGQRISQAVVLGDKVYLAGQVADQAAGEPVAAQTREILATIDRRLAAAGSDRSRLLSASIKLTDMGAFAEVTRVWDDWMIKGRTPGRTTVQAELASPDYAVEIAIIAAR